MVLRCGNELDLQARVDLRRKKILTTEDTEDFGVNFDGRFAAIIGQNKSVNKETTRNERVSLLTLLFCPIAQSAKLTPLSRKTFSVALCPCVPVLRQESLPLRVSASKQKYFRRYCFPGTTVITVSAATRAPPVVCDASRRSRYLPGATSVRGTRPA